MAVTVVSGGASGIGKAIVERLAARGEQVAILDIDEAKAREVADTLPGAAAFHCDVTDPGLVEKALAQVTEQLGAPTILVANQGATPEKPFLEMSISEAASIMALNYEGSQNLVRAALPGMVEAAYGRVVLVSSDAARIGVPRQSVYSGAKAALIGFGKALSVEVARHGVTVNIVCPGSTETPGMRTLLDEEGIAKRVRMHPMRRFARPEDLAVAVDFFTSADASFITGQVLSVNGGMLRTG